MQPGQSEHLRQLIENSSILSPGEKADWLDMLILMNDKQAAELEEILVNQRAPAPNNSVSPKLPPLTHISNLPAGLSTLPYRQPVAKPVAPANLPWNKQLPVPATPAVPASQASSSKASGIAQTIPRSPARSAPLTRPTAYAPQTPVKRRSVPSRVTLETLADTAKLSVAAVRNMNQTDLLIRLQQLSKMEGYFNLLSYLEDSPLYHSYINTGQKILTGQLSFEAIDPNDTSLLTREEFEAFADTLRNIQVN
jgi:hypothetical protein